MELNSWLEASKNWINKDREKISMLKQKARVKWDVEGDENSKYFHSIIKRRNNKNNIRGLMANGTWSEGPTKIKDEMFKYYNNMFMKDGRERPKFRNCNIARIDEEDATNLEIPFSEAEAIQWFWEQAEITRGLNASFVTLIPKVTDPIGLGDFRPISLIGCYYKIIAKILAEMVKKIIDKVIGEAQNAFIGGLYILDGVLIANETMDYIKKKKIQGMIFKLDFEKAYDQLRWCFEEVSGLGVNLKKSCLYGICVEGERVEAMARFMKCSVGESPFMYLGLPVGTNMSRIGAWRTVIEKFKKRLSE
ncbi:RNA-directed DNA polymerase, eukaryota [Tanacetum coccineum]